MKIGISLLLMLTSLITQAQHTIKIMSYNIFHGEHGYKKEKTSLDSIAAFIVREKPDVVMLQEVDSATGRLAALYGEPINWLQQLAEKTDMHGYFGKAMDYDGGGYGEGLLTKIPVDAQTVILPNPAGGEPRALIVAEYPVNNASITIGGTHLCHQFITNITAQVNAINKNISGSNRAIVAGDFNFTPEHPAFNTMTENWKDGDENNIPTFPADKPNRRIDYIWLSKKHDWKVLSFDVVPVKFSDHLPVIATIEVL